MNPKLAAILVLLIAGVVFTRLGLFFKEVEKHVDPTYNYRESLPNATEQAEPEPILEIPGLPESMEASLEKAQNKGHAALETWLKQYRNFIREPRLSDIELDYVIMVGRVNPPEARRLFAEIQKRNGPNSPLYERIQSLEKTYR